MPHDLSPTVSIPEQAAHWWVVFHDSGVESADHREFGEWIARSPERVEAYLRVARLHQVLRSRELHWPRTSAEDLIKEAKAASSSSVHELAVPNRIARDEGRRAWATPLRVVLSAAAVLLLGLFTTWMVLTRPQQFQTKLGEQRSVMLADGSRITLNTASKVEVDLRRDSRRIHLAEGEALFEVARDPSRPFEVRAGNALLRAVGTQFDVDLRPDSTTVTVVEGQVAVVAGHGRKLPTLGAADRVVIGQSGSASAQHGVNVAVALSWTQHQLVFEQRPLGEVAEEFNRYNRRRIAIDSATLRAQQVTGVFQSNDPASFVSFLSAIPGVRVREDGSGGVVVTLDAGATPGK
jgi:transmembrane sensor